MSTATTIREQLVDALGAAGPTGLSMAAIAGTVTGPWRGRDVEAVVRRLWEINELARRADGTFVLTQKVRQRNERPEVKRSRRRLDDAVRRVAEGARREGHDTTIRTRVVDPGLLRAYCPRCRANVHPRLDGTCTRCGTQTGANQEGPPKRRRRHRRRRLRKGHAAFGVVCPRCAGAKSKQAHTCRQCSYGRRAGRQLGPRPTHKPATNITDELLAEARRLYASGLSIRQVAERIYPQTSYASINACKTSLFSLFKTRGWKLRPQREVTRARSTKHGRKPRERSPEQERAYRHWLAAQRGWKTIHGPGRPACKGVRRQYPRKGDPCTRPAMEGSEYCYSHDPRFELERQTATARMRARAQATRSSGPVALDAAAA